VDLGCGLDEVLEMGAGEEVSEVDEFAVVLILNVNDSPLVLSSTNLLASYDDRLLRSDDCEWDDVLVKLLVRRKHMW